MYYISAFLIGKVNQYSRNVFLFKEFRDKILSMYQGYPLFDGLGLWVLEPEQLFLLWLILKTLGAGKA